MKYSSSRVGWVWFLVIGTIAFLYHCVYKGLDFEFGFLTLGAFCTGLKGWEKFLGYRYASTTDQTG